MIESMTGYGRAEYIDDDYFILIEAKSLNSKYADISINLPDNLQNIEIELQQLAKNVLKRGKIYINVDVKEKKPSVIPKVNKYLLNNALNVLYEIQKESGILDDVKIEHILYFKDIVCYEKDKTDDTKLEKLVINQVDNALLELKKMRTVEGEKIKASLDDSLKKLDSIIIFIRGTKDELLKNWFDKLKLRLSQLIADLPESRIIQEAAIYADKSDITEEVDRISFHITQFFDVINNECLVGRKLDFLCQELIREFHTMSAKIEDIHIAEKILLAKSEIEKIREQVQNIV